MDAKSLYALFATLLLAVSVPGCGQSTEKAEVPSNPVQAPSEMPGSLGGPPSTQ